MKFSSIIAIIVLTALLVFIGTKAWGLYRDNRVLKQQLEQLMFQSDSTLQIRENAIAKLANELDLQRLEFEQQTADLVNTLETRYDHQVLAYAQLRAQFHAYQDSIITVDTTIVSGEKEYEVRKFERWIVENEFYVSGWFEKQEPYRISFSDIFAFFQPEIILSRGRDTKKWALTVNSTSWWADVAPGNVIIDDELETRKDWNCFLGAGWGRAANFLAGAGYRNYSIYGTATAESNPYWAIGLMRTW